MVAIGWSNATPGDDVTDTSLDDEIRSMLTNIGGGLGTSFYWPGSAAQAGSAGSSGEMLLGTMRAPRGTVRAGGAGNGFIGQDTNPEAGGLWHVGSAVTFRFTGLAQQQEQNTTPGNAPYAARWVVSSGTAMHPSPDTTTSFSTTISYGVTYSGIPNIQVGVVNSNFDEKIYPIYGVGSVTATQFVSVLSIVQPGAPTLPDDIVGAVEVMWRSEGTVAF